MAWVSAPYAGALRVNWVDASSDETGFEVERASAVTGPFTLVGTTPADQASFDDTGLGASATYHYRVRAVNQAGASAFSNTASGATQAAGFQTAYIVASSDNTVRISSMNAQEELTVYQSNGNEVGCIWTFLDPVQHMLCDALLLRFDVSALAGKTILAAGINLFAERPAINQARYMMSALAGPWSPATVTFDNMPGSFQAGSWFLYSESVPTWMTWPATPIVQSWASGTWANNGVIVQDFDVVFPYLSLLRSTRFASREVYGDPARWPVLVVDYQ
jgi:hypothetical protein